MILFTVFTHRSSNALINLFWEGVLGPDKDRLGLFFPLQRDSV